MLTTTQDVKKLKQFKNNFFWFGYDQRIDKFLTNLVEGINTLDVGKVLMTGQEKVDLKKCLLENSVNTLYIRKFDESFKTFYFLRSYCFKFYFEHVLTSGIYYPLIKERILKSPCLELCFDKKLSKKQDSGLKIKIDFLAYLQDIAFKELHVNLFIKQQRYIIDENIMKFLCHASITDFTINCLNHYGTANLKFISKRLMIPPIIYKLKSIEININASLAKKQLKNLTGDWFKGDLTFHTFYYYDMFEMIDLIIMFSFLREVIVIAKLSSFNAVKRLSRSRAKYILSTARIKGTNEVKFFERLSKDIYDTERDIITMEPFLRKYNLLI